MEDVRSLGLVRRAFVVVALSVGVGLLVPVKKVEADQACSARYDISVSDIIGDKDTGLTWEDQAGGTIYTHADAKNYCGKLKLNGKLWRLPTVFELQTIVDESKISPAIDKIMAKNTQSSYYWSSSPYGDNSGNPNSFSSVWAVNFDDGSVGHFDKEDNTFRVRCVN